MENDESIGELNRLLSVEEHQTGELKATREAGALQKTRGELLQHVRGIARNKDLALIVATERAFVQGDLDRYASGSEMKGSLTTALEQFDAMERLIGLVDDLDNPEKYREVDRDYSLRTSRRNGLPIDEARQGFSSHHARLTNMTKGRLDDEERKLVDARKTVILDAGRFYAEKQARILGLGLAQGRRRESGP